jgi:aryl-alcohol dehydrogenase-like predicted oxidoreductase
VLATKFGWPLDAEGKLKGASRAHILWCVEGSLRRLNTDWIDLYQMHLPDPLTPIEETLRALDDLVRQGKVRFIGCSNLSGPEVEAALQASKSHGLGAFITCQNEYNLLNREIESGLKAVMDRHGLGLITAAPLAAGLLTGKYRADAPMPANGRLNRAATAPRSQRFVNEDNWKMIEELRAFAVGRGHTLLELAVSWLAAQDTVSSVIAGGMSPEQVEQNVRAAGWAIGAGDLAEIDRITRK